MALGIGNTWESALGSGMVYRHSLIIESYYRALAFRKDKDMRFRETVPRSIREGIISCAVSTIFPCVMLKD